MKDDSAIMMVPVMAVGGPLFREIMELDVPFEECSADTDERIPEIGSAVAVDRSRREDINLPTVGCPELCCGELLVFPELPEEPLRHP
jgi:hypothetical protein